MSGTGMFLELLNKSLVGSAVIAAVVLLRLFMKRMPKRYVCFLWFVPFARLLFQIEIPSPWSLLPVNPRPLVSSETLGTGLLFNTGIRPVDGAVNQLILRIGSSGTAADTVSWILSAACLIWAVGAAAFAGFQFYRYFQLKRRLSTAFLGEDGAWYSDRITMPMVVGLLHPKIYLPSLLAGEENRRERAYILAHEQAHIARKDHLTKLFAFVILALHWFNPFVWAAFWLYGEDVEMACDERVMERFGAEEKKGYSLALLHFEERRSAAFMPLAFGESSTGSRIRNILNYKKPAFWVSLAAFILFIALCAAFLTNPDDASVAVIGGADGPTSTFIAGKVGDAGKNAGAVSIIGGADGPTSIFLAGKNGEGEQEKAKETDLQTAKKEPYGPVVELDYVSAGKVSLHGTFGYLVYSIEDRKIIRAVTLEEAGPISVQGDSYTEIMGGDGGALIVTNAYNRDDVERQFWMYEEENSTISYLGAGTPAKEQDSSSDGEGEDREFVNRLLELTGQGALRDAVLEGGEYLGEVSRLEQEKYGLRLLYGPAAVIDMDSEVYGVLAADGENLGDLWYGVWRPGTDEILQYRLFPENE